MYSSTRNASFSLWKVLTLFLLFILFFATVLLHPSTLFAAPYGEGAYGEDIYEGGTSSPEPTSEPAPSSGPSTSSRSGGRVSAPTCPDLPPPNAPDLFQINSSADAVTLSFSPVGSPRDRYVVQYGTAAGQYQHAYEFENSEDGVVLAQIKSLQPGTQYFFTVRAGNGCAVGPWSNELSAPAGQQAVTYRWGSVTKILSTAVTKRLNPSAVSTVEIDTAVRQDELDNVASQGEAPLPEVTEPEFAAPAAPSPTPTLRPTTPRPVPVALPPQEPVPAVEPTQLGFFARIGQFFSRLFDR